METVNKPELEYFGSHEAPCYATQKSAGFDFRAEIPHSVTLAPFERMAIPTGVRIKLPDGYELQVRPRSGLAFLSGIMVVNAPGTVDADYYPREINALLINISNADFEIKPGDRIAQGVVSRYVVMPELIKEATATRAGGFGSTGI